MSKPLLGCGVGLRSEHYDFILKNRPAMDWFEAITENFIDSEGQPLRILEQIRKNYAVGLHGVSLSIGSADGVQPIYLENLKKLSSRIEPAIISDHLCWTGIGGENLHDLLPLPFTEEAIAHVVRQIEKVQTALKRQILLENVSSYVSYKHSTLPEWEFLTQVAQRSGCGILLDVNNVYVNAFNHKFDATEYLKNIPSEFVGQFHLAGHTNRGNYLFDTHNDYTIEPVWELYRLALELYGKTTTLIEWDANIPPFEELAKEAAKARGFYEKAKTTPALRSTSRGEMLAYSNVSPRDVVRSQSPSLSEIQTLFKDALHPHAQVSEKLSGILNQQGGEMGSARMAIYAEGYVARFQESLAESFESIKAILGEEAFAAASEAYAKFFASHDYNISWIGKHFVEFLEGSEATEELPYLPDLARLDWAISKNFHSSEEAPMDFRALSAVAPEEWENLKFQFQPYVALIRSDWPVGTMRSKKTADLPKNSQDVLVYREGVKMRSEILDPAQAALLEGLLAGKTLGLALETVQAEDCPAGEWFSQWAAKKILVGYTAGASSGVSSSSKR